MDEKKVGLEQVVKLLRENKAFLEGEIERNREVCEKLDKRISAVHKRNTSQEDWAMLRKTFSSKQVQHFQSKFKRVSGYSDDDHAISWTLHNLMRNRRSYECIRYNMQIPLPNRSKISRWRRQNRKRTEVDGSKKIQEQDIISEEHQHSESEDQDTQI